MAEHKARLDEYLERHLDAYIQETARLCAQPSVSARSEGTHACAVIVADMLSARGYDVRVIDTPLNPVVVGRLRGRSERTLMFYNHYDVQPPEPLELWTSPPFEPTVRDGALYARGAKDDKGEFVARLAAVDAVREAHGGELPCGVLFVVEGQEEIGSPHIAEFVRQNLDLLACDGAVWEEGVVTPGGRSLNILGVRGALMVELRVRALRKDAHSGGAHLLPNAAWRLLRALASLKDEEERILIPGFYDAARPPSDLDRAMTASNPDLAQEIQMMREVFLPEGGAFLRSGSDVDLALSVFQPTCNIQGLTSGYQGEGGKTVIPAEASAKLDFRLVPDQDPLDALAKLRAHLDAQGFTDVEILSEGNMMWPAKAEGDNPLVRLTSDAAREVYGQPALELPMIGGSSPVYAFAGPLGNIPVVTAGLGYWDSRTHSPDEHIRIQDFHLAARHIARIVDGFASVGEATGG